MLGTPTSNESYKYLQEAVRLSICNDNRHVSVYLMTPHFCKTPQAVTRCVACSLYINHWITLCILMTSQVLHSLP